MTDTLMDVRIDGKIVKRAIRCYVSPQSLPAYYKALGMVPQPVLYEGEEVYWVADSPIPLIVRTEL